VVSRDGSLPAVIAAVELAVISTFCSVYAVRMIVYALCSTSSDLPPRGHGYERNHDLFKFKSKKR
jgi:hypothetical protein